MHIKIEAISLPFEKPFTITGATYTSCDTIRLTVDNGTHQGIGEAIGVDYMGESIDSIIAQLEAIQSDLANGADHESIQTLLPPGGARNALDCALWDLAAKREGKRVWDFLGMSVSPVQTVFTIGIDEPETMAAGAAQAKALPHLKIKLDADRPIEKLEAIRAVRPDATFIVDANQGWDIHLLKDILPRLEQLDIALLEQPLRRGDDEDLRGLETRIPIGADESLQHIGEFPHIAEI
ncbi:MAG: enolase C-terminal domain-like protein, partial [Pseudomonadota bacterium]